MHPINPTLPHKQGKWLTKRGWRLTVTVNPIRVRTLAQVLLIIALTLITWLALTPDPPPASQVIGWDKANHALAFMVLALLTHFSAQQYYWSGWGALIIYGIGIEIVQAQIGTRYFEWSDMLANAVGVGIYVFSRPILFKLTIIQTLKPEQDLT